jgi:hypothetical protein
MNTSFQNFPDSLSVISYRKMDLGNKEEEEEEEMIMNNYFPASDMLFV